MNEMVESLNIINQVLLKFLKKTHLNKNHETLKYFMLPKGNPYKNMESLIQHFKY